MKKRLASWAGGLLVAGLLPVAAFGQAAPVLSSAASRMSHSGTTYDLGLPLSGNSGIECRVATVYGTTLVLNFDKPLQSGSAAVTAGTARVNGAAAVSGSALLVPLTGFTNAQAVTVQYSNVVAGGGSAAAAGTFTFRVLEGDVNASGSVSVADVNLAKYYTGQAVSGFNARADVNCTNSITVGDVNVCKYRAGTSVAGGAAANTPPTVSDVADQSTTTGKSVAVPVTVGDAETSAGSLAVRVVVDNATLVPAGNVAVSGTGAARTVTLVPAANQTGTSTVRVSVSDGLLTATDTFLLTVTASGGGGSGTTTLYVADLRPEGTAQSSGSGSSTLTLSADETYAVVKIAYSNLSTTKTGMHIHGPADPGAIGAVLFDLDSAPQEADGSWKWTFVQSGNTSAADQVAALKAGRVYLNVHTSRYPAGELRGHYLLAAGSQTFTPPPAPPALPGGAPTQADAARFLAQATFGGTEEEINKVVSIGYAAWIDQQTGMAQTTQQSILQRRKAAEGSLNFNHYQDSWWQLVNTSNDQLRQRVAFALAELFVVSENKSILGQFPEGMGNYYDILGRNAFGNFRQLLEEVTLNPMMGEYLNMRGSVKADAGKGTNPNENYARELMQLFTIGVRELHPDGTLRLDANGMPVDSYDQNVVIGMARALTGWNYGGSPGNTDPPFNYMLPMASIPVWHETGTKLLTRGVTVPAGGTCESDLKAALDNVFNHPNTGPFVCRQLIQRLVCSNPSPGYVYRVAQVFANNGAGVRGDMKAVIRAILLDYEARSNDMLSQQGYGKLKEPLLRTTQLLRALHGYSSSGWWACNGTDEELGQTPMRAPTVFNFFEPTYSPPGAIAANGLAAPEFQITNETTVMNTSNWLQWGAFWGLKYGDMKTNLTTEANLAGNPAALVERLNLLLCSGQMTSAQKTIVVNHVNTVPAGDPLTRAKVAVYLVVTSAQCAVQR